MKIRIRDNSLRLRLTKGEVKQLANTGDVTCNTEFGHDVKFTYQIKASDQAEIIASFNENVISIIVPEEKISHWANSEEVSLRAEQNTLSAEPLRILIEKDFACLIIREGEDDSDAFPNPT